MNNIFISPDPNRATYERIVDMLAQQLSKGGQMYSADDIRAAYKIYRSQLVMGVALNPGLSSYTLSPRKGVDPTVQGTILLDQNDFFGIDKIGLRFGKADYASATGAVSNLGNYRKWTWPTPKVFGGAGEAAALQTILQGNFAVTVSSDTLVDGLLCQDLCYVNDNADTTTGEPLLTFGGNDGDRGLFDLTPQLILDASADNGFVINLASGTKTVIDGSYAGSTTRNFLYVVASGWKIKNLAGAGLTCPTRV